MTTNVAKNIEPSEVLMGLLFFDDGSFMPSVILDLSKNPELERRIRNLYQKDRINHISIHIESEGIVFIEAIEEYLDGTKAEELVARFMPDKADDIDAFLGAMSASQSWILAARLAHSEIHFVVSCDTDAVIKKDISRRLSRISAFGVKK